jgi:flagellar basal body-associated protein FliL
MEEQPQYTPPPAAPEKKSNTTLIIIIVIAVLILCCCPIMVIAILALLGPQVNSMFEQITSGLESLAPVLLPLLV